VNRQKAKFTFLKLFSACISAAEEIGLVNAKYLVEGPSTCVRIRVRFPVGFHAQFAGSPDRDPILHLTPITMVCRYILAKTNQKCTFKPPRAGNRTPNLTPIGTQNRTCRQPLARKRGRPTTGLEVAQVGTTKKGKKRRGKKRVGRQSFASRLSRSAFWRRLRSKKSAIWRRLRLRGLLHVYESVYDSPYDFLHDLRASLIGLQFFI
jgi:hypothetical protein